MTRGDGLADAELARQVRPGRDRGHDHPPAYVPSFQPGWDNLDPARHDVSGCWPALTTQRLIGSNVPRWRATCRNCHLTFRGDTEAEALAAARRAHGDEA